MYLPIYSPSSRCLQKRDLSPAVPQITTVEYYRNAADVCICLQGLYLWVRPFLGSYEPTMIPWSEFREPRGTMLRLQQAVRLTVGDPAVTTVTFTRGLYEKLRPYLSAAESVESARR